MAIYPYQFINTRGIPTVETTGVSVGTDAVTFQFKNHAAFNTPFRGLLLVKIGQEIPAGTTATLPIRFTSEVGGTNNVTTTGGANLTVAGIPGTGVYLFYYDRLTDVLQVITV